MKLNQAVSAAFVSASATFASSSSAASVSSHKELKDKIAPLLASSHNHLHRMLQELTDQCIADIEAPFSTFVNAIDECALAQTETTVVMGGDTATLTVDANYSACDSSLFTEACTADKGTIVGFVDMGVDCTFMGESLQIKVTSKGSPVCFPPSCVSYWESGKGQLLADVEKEMVEKEMENIYSEALAAEGIDPDDGECKMNNYSVVSSSVIAGEGPTTTNSPTKPPQTSAPTSVTTTEPTKPPQTSPPTLAPTEAPTTPAPTSEPTKPPRTSSPTLAPTEAEAPTTPAPTSEPTKPPRTSSPTLAPTEAPTTPAPTSEVTRVAPATNAAVDPSAGKPTATGASAAESLVVGSSANKASGMIAITATSVAAALFFF